jgi:hypothetical protein
MELICLQQEWGCTKSYFVFGFVSKLTDWDYMAVTLYQIEYNNIAHSCEQYAFTRHPSTNMAVV